MKATLSTIAILIVSLAVPASVLADGRGQRDRDRDRGREVVASARTNPAGPELRHGGDDRGRHLGWEKGKGGREWSRGRHGGHETTVVRVVERPVVTHRHVTYAYVDREPCRDTVVVVRPYRPPVSSSLAFYFSW